MQGLLMVIMTTKIYIYFSQEPTHQRATRYSSKCPEMKAEFAFTCINFTEDDHQYRIFRPMFFSIPTAFLLRFVPHFPTPPLPRENLESWVCQKNASESVTIDQYFVIVIHKYVTCFRRYRGGAKGEERGDIPPLEACTHFPHLGSTENRK